MFGFWSTHSHPFPPPPPPEFRFKERNKMDAEVVMCYRGKDGSIYETLDALKKADRVKIINDYFTSKSLGRYNLGHTISAHWDDLKRILNEN